MECGAKGKRCAPAFRRSVPSSRRQIAKPAAPRMPAVAAAANRPSRSRGPNVQEWSRGDRVVAGEDAVRRVTGAAASCAGRCRRGEVTWLLPCFLKKTEIPGSELNFVQHWIAPERPSS
jgi:hypothetical protein